MRFFSISAALLALVATALIVAAEPEPQLGGFAKNAKNANANNAAFADNANAAVKTDKFDRSAAINQGFGFNQAKKDTNAFNTAAQKNQKNAANKKNAKNNAFNNVNFPGFKGKGFGGFKGKGFGGW